MFFLNIDSWKTLLILDKAGGRTTLYATSPTLSKTPKGPTNLGFNLPFLPNLITPFMGASCRKTLSPISSFEAFLLMS